MRCTFVMGLVALCLGLFLVAPDAYAGPSAEDGLDALIVQYVAQSEGEPTTMKVPQATDEIASETEAPPEMAAAESPSSWSFLITPYLWAIGIDGSMTVRGNEGDLDMDFSDILGVTNFALMLRGEAWNGPLGLSLDFT